MAVECKGGELPNTAGLLRGDNRWKVLGQALAVAMWNAAHPDAHLRFVVVASAQPTDDAGSAGLLRRAELAGYLTIVVVPLVRDDGTG